MFCGTLIYWYVIIFLPIKASFSSIDFFSVYLGNRDQWITILTLFSKKTPHYKKTTLCLWCWMLYQRSVMVQLSHKATVLYLCEHFYIPCYFDPNIVHNISLAYFGKHSKILFCPFSWPFFFFDLCCPENKNRNSGISPGWILPTHPSFTLWQI